MDDVVVVVGVFGDVYVWWWWNTLRTYVWWRPTVSWRWHTVEVGGGTSRERQRQLRGA
jgi:hypothetical protein